VKWGAVAPAPASQRKRILDSMVSCCAEKTYAETTIADIVGRASVSRTTFYKLFSDKRDCFDAAVTHCIERLGATLAKAADGYESPAEATRRATVAGLELLAAEPELALVLSGDVVGVDPRRVDRYGKLAIPAVESLWTRAGKTPRKHSSPGIAFGRAQLLVFHEVAAGRAEKLPALVPNIVYLAIAPFAGHDEGLRQARLAAGLTADVTTRRAGGTATAAGVAS
jgi:AcrR family transcriptional regulator